MINARRQFILQAVTTVPAFLLASKAERALANQSSGTAAKVDSSVSARALSTIMEGNSRFVDGKINHPGRKPADFAPLAAGQTPLAAIVGCADSRVSPEILFDVGIGDLFVIRVAGNYINGAGSSVKGSIEYAVLELGVPLIMILGHSGCGAVKAAIQHLRKNDALPGSINDLVNNIKPAVLEAQQQHGDLLENATRANVGRGVQRLKTLGPILAPRVAAGSLKVVGGVYDLSTGKVNLLEA